MRRRRYRDESRDSQTLLLLVAGAVAGAAAGVYGARRFGSLFAFTRVLRGWMRDFAAVAAPDDELIDDEPEELSMAGPDDEDELVDALDQEPAARSVAPPHAPAGRGQPDRAAPAPPARSRADLALEDRVLSAFESDLVLVRRALDISAVGPGVIELTGWVRSNDEAARAAAVARDVPGVEMVLNRVAVRGAGRLDTASVPRETTPPERGRGVTARRPPENDRSPT
jgi:hypothetical protein